MDERGENATTIYRLRFKGDDGQSRAVVRNSYHRSTGYISPVVSKTYPQHTVLQQTVSQYSKDRSFSKEYYQVKGGVGRSKLTSPALSEDDEEDGGSHPRS